MTGAPARRAELEAIFGEALAAVDAGLCLQRVLGGGGDRLEIGGRPLPAGARIVLLAVGKAAAPMAAVFEAWAGERLAAGLVVTKTGHGASLERCVLREAAHPVPDASSVDAARAALALVEASTGEDVLCVLLSGGASSLLACPAPGLALEDLAVTTRLLLEAGADIEELNTVRKHLSAVAGGRLARRAGAGRIEVLTVSDVPGDRIDLIGSGPFAADPGRFGDAVAVLERRVPSAGVPAAVRAHLEAGVRGAREETAKAGDPALAGVRTTLLASNRTAVEAACHAIRRRGLRARVVSEPLAGEAREQARRLVSFARALHPSSATCLVAGGETVVTVRGPGRGGRNQELALAAALELAGGPPTALLAVGTDGSDGPTGAAGAYADEGTAERGRRRGVDPVLALEHNDSHAFFAAEGGCVSTGPTGTNVMDLVLLRVEPEVD